MHGDIAIYGRQYLRMLSTTGYVRLNKNMQMYFCFFIFIARLIVYKRVKSQCVDWKLFTKNTTISKWFVRISFLFQATCWSVSQKFTKIYITTLSKHSLSSVIKSGRRLSQRQLCFNQLQRLADTRRNENFKLKNKKINSKVPVSRQVPRCSMDGVSRSATPF